MPKQTVQDFQLLILASMNLGQRVRFIRELMCHLFGKTKYSTNSLSKAIGVTPQTLTAIERGDSQNPSFNVIHRLAKAFHVKVEVFTDEYYQTQPIQSFTIGFIEDDEVLDLDWEKDDNDTGNLTDTLEQNAQLGIYITQHFEQGETRIITSHLTRNNIEPTRLVETLCRISTELLILDQASSPSRHIQFSELTDNPYNVAVEQYHSFLANPHDHPKGKTEYWNNLIADFNEHASQYQKQKETV